jgi:hypothetical protein
VEAARLKRWLDTFVGSEFLKTKTPLLKDILKLDPNNVEHREFLGKLISNRPADFGRQLYTALDSRASGRKTRQNAFSVRGIEAALKGPASDRARAQASKRIRETLAATHERMIAWAHNFVAFQGERGLAIPAGLEGDGTFGQVLPAAANKITITINRNGLRRKEAPHPQADTAIAIIESRRRGPDTDFGRLKRAAGDEVRGHMQKSLRSLPHEGQTLSYGDALLWPETRSAFRNVLVIADDRTHKRSNIVAAALHAADWDADWDNASGHVILPVYPSRRVRNIQSLVAETVRGIRKYMTWMPWHIKTITLVPGTRKIENLLRVAFPQLP